MRLARLLLLLGLCLPATAALAQSGKIAGVVTDATTGDPLPGVNVAIDGTTQGAVTNVEGYYVILNIRPGTYDVRASFIGFTPEVREGVRVNIDLTSEVNFQLREETVGLDEVVVAAERPIVQRDVSASVANISAEEIENLPVTDVERVIGLQAGFERGLTIRGGSGSQVQFMVDGFSMTSGRDNVPFTGISYTAVEEIAVQTGGFNAEYGNVRAGLVNVVTKEGGRSRYTADVILRYSPPAEKYFGENPGNEDSWALRPFFDAAVAMPGTAGGTWDQFTRNQYAEFVGWEKLATDLKYNNDADPNNNMTAAEMQDAFRWYIRKDMEIKDPDYEFDGTIGGPVPLVSRMLGDLRFSASYRQEQQSILIPLVRSAYGEQTAQGKLTSDLGQGMRLNVNALWARQEGINTNEQGDPNMWTGKVPYYPWDDVQDYLVEDGGMNDPSVLFAYNWRNPMDVTRSLIGADFTHTLNARTFYEVKLQRMLTEYNTFVEEERDQTVLRTIGPLQLTEEPFGWEWRDTYDQLGVGFRNGGHWFSSRDSSQVTRWLAKFDLTSQINRYLQGKAGVEYLSMDYETNYGEVDPAHPHHTNPKFVWDRSPLQGAAYAQGKLEFKGMVANVGMRADYFHAGGEWYVYDTYDPVLSAQYGRELLDVELSQEPTDRQITLSPRLGVSFPITDNSKLYFNYGHFREMPNPISLFNISEINTGAVRRIGNPNLDLPKTVMYELGYEQNIANTFLLRLAGYYRDLSLQSRAVHYENLDGEVQYDIDRPYRYGDVRGFEVTLYKNTGRFVRGFLNYTYMAYKDGNFGFANIYQNRVRMREYLTTTQDHYQSKPIPEPFARLNLEFLLPEDFGPDTGGMHLLGDWRVNLLGEWRMGASTSWTGSQLVFGRSPNRDLQGNVRWKDFYTLDMRFAKNFATAVGDAQLFIDVTNVLNLKHMSRFPFRDDRDRERYMRSLRLPEDVFDGLESGAPYAYIPGDDRPGDYRKEGVAFQPIDVMQTLDAAAPGAGTERVWRYSLQDEAYYRWSGSQWTPVAEGDVDQMLEDKAYIDMPNNTSFTFLNPRNVFFGIRLTF